MIVAPIPDDVRGEVVEALAELLERAWLRRNRQRDAAEPMAARDSAGDQP